MTFQYINIIRSFFKYLDRNEIIKNVAIKTIKTPKTPRSIPKPLSQSEAKKAIETISQLHSTPWIAARDLAILMLLYGCGLRISEALNLNVGDLPTDGIIIVDGKGKKQRIVPILPTSGTDQFLGIRVDHARQPGQVFGAHCQAVFAGAPVVGLPGRPGSKNETLLLFHFS